MSCVCGSPKSRSLYAVYLHQSSAFALCEIWGIGNALGQLYLGWYGHWPHKQSP